MIIKVKSTTLELVIPDGYQKSSPTGIIKGLKQLGSSSELYCKITENADCRISISKKKDAKMDYAETPEDIVDHIHSKLSNDEGLIQVGIGNTVRDIPYCFQLIKHLKSEMPPSGVSYYLLMEMPFGSETIEIMGLFTEIGTTGMRDAIGYQLAQAARLIGGEDGDDLFAGWTEDPYDPNFTKGKLMNLSEREGLDGLFTNHPLSQAREMIHALLCDELMLPIDDAESEKEAKVQDSSFSEQVATNNDSGTVRDKSDPASQLSQEELARLLLSKETKRRFVPQKEIVGQTPDLPLPRKDNKATSGLLGKKQFESGLAAAKKGLSSAKGVAVKTASAVQEKSKELQMSVLRFVDKKKNAKFLEAKLSSFEDGLNEGKAYATDYIKKYVNFCLASTAISYYFARCDGSIDENEQLEIEHDLDSIIKNRDLPAALRNKLYEISNNENLSFEEVREYLDGVGKDTLKEFSNDIEEIIFADGMLSEAEKAAKAVFDAYCSERLGDG